MKNKDKIEWQGIGCLIIILFLIVSGVIKGCNAIVVAWNTPPPSAEQIAADNREKQQEIQKQQIISQGRSLYELIRTHIASQLMRPETADFPWEPETTTKLNETTYIITGYVDSKNNLGETRRSTFSYGLEKQPDGKWSIIKADLFQQ